MRPESSIDRAATGGGPYPGSSSIAVAEVALETITMPRPGARALQTYSSFDLMAPAWAVTDAEKYVPEGT